VQLLKIESAGTAGDKAVLADVKSKSAGATATELLRLFLVRRRWALSVRSADLLCGVLCAARCLKLGPLSAMLCSPGLGHLHRALAQASCCTAALLRSNRF
jgi:hypothetical protein